jgi:hypothetical protein
MHPVSRKGVDGFKTPTEYLDDQFTFDRDERSYRVLRSALVAMRRYYAAVERIEKLPGERSVVAIICLVDYNPRNRDGHLFGYKDMDETFGACEVDCPAAILDLLTPTDSKWANEWRQSCRARLAKPKPRAGQTLVLATPLKFSDGETLARFHVVEKTWRNRKKLVFRGDNGGDYRIRNLRDLEYMIEEAQETQKVTAPAPVQTSLF